MATIIWCVWAAHTSAVPPEASAYTTAPPDMAVSTTDTPELSVLPITALEAVT